MTWIVAGLVGLMLVGAGLVLSRHIRANGRRIDELEGLLGELSEADRIVSRANGRRDRSHLKLLGLIPVGWLFGTSRRVLAVTAATATLTGAGYLATDGGQQPSPPMPPPAEAAESESHTADADMPSRPDTSSDPSDTTTSTDPAAAVTPPAAAAVTGSASTHPSPSPAPAPSTTTTTLEVTVDTTLPVEPVELPRPCLNPQVAEVGIRLCPVA